MSWKDATIIIGGVAGLLTLSLIAMQFSEEVDWSVGDFIIAGVLLASAAVIVKLFISKIHVSKTRFALGVALLVAIVYIWAELAVGVFTNLGS